MISRIWPAFNSAQVLFRAYRNESARNRKTGKPKGKAFYRRADELGISVFLTRDAALAGLNAAGFCTFIAGEVIQCPGGLVIIQETEDHAEIRPVPLMNEDEKRALDIANYLVDISTDVPI